MDTVPLVASEIVKRFHEKAAGRPSAAAVTEELCALLTRLWLVGSEGLDAAGNVAAAAEDIETLVDGVLAYLGSCSAPSLATVLLQSQGHALKAALLSKRRTEEVKREAIGLRLIEAIVDHDGGAPGSAEEILGDMTLYFLHCSGQLQSLADPRGSSGDSLPARTETAAVLCSVLPRSQVAGFARQAAAEKRRQLEELRRIVLGIRVFHQAEGKATGAGLTNPHALVDNALEALELPLGREMDAVDQAVMRCLAVLRLPSSPLPAAEQSLLRDEYHHLRQRESNLLTVRCIAAALRARAETTLLPTYDNCLAELRQVLQPTAAGSGGGGGGSQQPAVSASPPAEDEGEEGERRRNDDTPATAEDAQRARWRQRESVKKRTAYPLFTRLAEMYTLAVRTVEEADDAACLLRLTEQSGTSYASSLPAKIAEDALAHVNADPPPARMDAASAAAEVERLAAVASATATAAVEAGPSGDESTLQSVGLRMRYEPEAPLTLMDATVAAYFPSSFCGLRGFCPVTYVESGLLVPGRIASRATDPGQAGLIVVDGGVGPRWALPRPLHLCFASEAALRRFAASPMEYLRACLQCNHATEPGTTLLMGLLDRLPRELYVAGSRVVEDGASVGCAAARGRVDAQTQTGQMDAHLDRNYRWNEWDLRRQALKLANLLSMRTHSTQTAASHFRRDNTTQADVPKDAVTQTAQDAATQPPRVVQYLTGLRGTESSEVGQVQRTILY